jgi:protein-tyrosine phosphatase
MEGINMINVVFVCLGNICRSPMAEAIFRQKVNDANLAEQIKIDSAGTGDWHIGDLPHEGTRNILDQRQISYEQIRARQIIKADLQHFDYIIAMDAKNIGVLHKLAGQESTGLISRLLDFIPNFDVADVPDPYFTGNFDEVYDMVNEACDHLLSYIRKEKNI